MATLVCTVLILAAMPIRAAPPGASSLERPWLFVSDIHLDVRKYKKPDEGEPDTDLALMHSFLAQARTVDPDPPVVVVAGDFIAHHARKAQNARTMALIASLFDKTFPRAQFVFTLGNNDSACGDYAAPIDGQFLRLVARAWAPLVDRDGASPDFVRRFSHDGSYVAALPEPGLRVVVTNDNFLSLRYDGKCANGDSDAPVHALETLRADLQSAPAGTRSWVLFHEPPGVDAYSTAHVAHQLLVVPFLRPDYRDALLAILGDPRSRVALVVAGHTHKFSFRILPTANHTGIPLLLVPSVSPIFLNDPSFLRVPVERNGTLGDVTQFAFTRGRWQFHGDLASLGVSHFDVPSLRALLTRLKKSPTLVDRFSTFYEAGGKDEIDERNALVYLCAVNQFADPTFETCAGKSGFHFVTRRGLIAGFDAGLSLLGIIVIGFLILRARRAVGA
jgi:predicted phosphodiesterase